MQFLILLTFGAVFLIEINGEFGKIIDLTWDFDEKTTYWTGQQPFVFTKKIGNSNERGYWYAMNEFCAAEHGGTHFDAPYHFYSSGWKVGEVPTERLVAKGVFVDLSNETKTTGSETVLNVFHLENWQKQNGNFENGSVLLVKFGWSQYWFNQTRYMGNDSKGALHFPGISKAAAEWLVNSGKFYGVGLDTASVDPGNGNEFLTHRTLSAHQIYNMENVKLTEDLPAKGFTLLVMPMKIKEGTGAPLRLLAIIPRIKD